MQVSSANERWKKSGTTLSFKEYLIREKKKMASFSGEGNSDIIINQPLNQAVQDSLNEARIDAGFITKGGKGNTVFGINKYILIASGLIIVGAVAYNIYTKSKK